MSVITIDDDTANILAAITSSPADIFRLARIAGIDAKSWNSFLGAAALGKDPEAKRVLETLLAYPSTGSSSRLEHDEANPVFRFIIDNCRDAISTVRGLFEELADWRLEPAVFGHQQVSLRPPTGIHATRLTGQNALVSWNLLRSGDVGLEVVSLDNIHLGSMRVLSGPSPILEIAVNELRPQHLVADSLFAFAVQPGMRWRDDPNRELIVLVASGALPGSNADPFSLVRQGYLAEAWLTGIERSYGDDELLALQLLIWPSMRALLEQAADQCGELTEEIDRVLGELDGRQHSTRQLVLQRIQHKEP